MTANNTIHASGPPPGFGSTIVGPSDGESSLAARIACQLDPITSPQSVLLIVLSIYSGGVSLSNRVGIAPSSRTFPASSIAGRR
jgi:hypothetical protein